jgi:hypothetical protein
MQAAELATRIPYKARYINDYLKDRVFIEGTHYVRFPGSRRIMYIWEAIQADYLKQTVIEIPMANGGVCHG